MPAAHRNYDDANYHQHESSDEKRAKCSVDMMSRIPVAIEQQAEQTQILKKPVNELRNNFTPGRLGLDVGDQVEPLRQSLRILRSEDQQRNQSKCKDSPRLD